MNEIERKELCEINRELMVANADYNDLLERVGKLAKKIFMLKKIIEAKLNGD